MNDVMSFSLDKVRHDTPSCREVLHFNNAGASLMPSLAYQAMCHHLSLEQSIGGYEAAAQSFDKVDSFYTAFADLLNAQPDEIAYVENATRAWDMTVYALPFQAGDRVLVHEAEYSSNYLALLQLVQSKGIEIDLVPSDESGQIDCGAIDGMITPRTKAIFLTHVPSHGGLVNPAEDVGKIVRKHNIIYVLDACQSVGQMPVDVKAIGCDILCGTGRKFLRGPRGTGFLYVSKRILNDLHPAFIDLHAAEWTSTNNYTLRSDAKRFEGWERFVAGQIALGEAARYAMDIGLSVIEERIQFLANILRNQLQTIEGVRLHDRGVKKCGIVTFSYEGTAAADIVERLRAKGINTSAAKLEHARLDLEKRDISSLVRASVHYYNTEDEVKRFCSAIQHLDLL